MLRSKLLKSDLVKEQAIETIDLIETSAQKRWRSTFAYQKELKDLKICIDNSFFGDYSPNVEKFFQQLTKVKEGHNFQNLRSLTITLSNPDDFNPCLDIISKFMRENFKILQKLQLNLPLKQYDWVFRRITTTIDPIVSLLGPHLRTLTSLSIRNINSNRELITLTEELQSNLRGLHTLHLDFTNCSLDFDIWTMNLARQIGANSRSLQNFYFKFREIPEFKAELILKFMLSLGPERNYKNLVIDFPGRMNFTKLRKRASQNQSLSNLFINSYGLDLKRMLEYFDELSNLEIEFGENDINFDLEIERYELTTLFKLTIPKFEMLKRLSLKFHGELTDSNEPLFALSSALGTHLRALESLYLHFESCDIVDDTVLDLAYQIGANLQALQSLSMHFGECGYERSYKSAIALFNQVLANAKTLKSLNVEFKEKIKISNTLGILPLKTIYETLNNAPLISDLTFEFYRTQTTDKLLLEFFEQIGSNLSHIQAITVDFKRYRIIQPETLMKLSETLFPILVSLKSLNLNFARCKYLDSSSILALFTRISSHFQELQGISLNFSECAAITDETVIALSEHLQSNLPALQSVSLSLKKCEHITDESIKVFSRTVSRLTSLHLDLEYCMHFSDESVFALCGIPSRIILALHNLEFVTSKYNMIQKITQESLAILSGDITTGFSNIQSLSLDRESSTRVSDKSIKELHSNVEFDHNVMQSLSFNFQGYDDKIKVLMKNLIDTVDLKLNGIKQLYLNFKGCPQITSLSLLALRQQIAHFGHIQSLSLNFEHCDQATLESILDLAKCIRSNLIHLDTFNFNGSRLQIKSNDCNFKYNRIHIDDLNYYTDDSPLSEEVAESLGSGSQENEESFLDDDDHDQKESQTENDLYDTIVGDNQVLDNINDLELKNEEREEENDELESEQEQTQKSEESEEIEVIEYVDD